MADGAWIALAGTALGGFIGWLNGWAQSRRERDREDRSTRRAVFTDFLYRSQSLRASVRAVIDELEHVAGRGETSTKAMESEMRARIERDSVEFARSLQGLELAASSEVRVAAARLAENLGKLADLTRLAIGVPWGKTDRSQDDLFWEIASLSTGSGDREARELILELMKKDLRK